MSAEELQPDHPAWAYETQYVAYAIANIVCTLSPRRIIVGGSVSKGGPARQNTPSFGLFDGTFKPCSMGTWSAPSLLGDGIDEYIVPPLLGDDAGVCGAIALGQCALA